MSHTSPAAAHAHMPVAKAVRQASAATGAGFGYLMRTAMRESSMDPNAKAATSSATGLFQFIDQTWLGVMRNHGAEHGLGKYANAIQTDSRGRQYVPDADTRREILALRKDPKVASLMAASLTEDNRQTLQTRLGRPVSDGELYAAHFLGPESASRLIQSAEQRPDASAASLLPSAARANRSIFYDAGGHARSAAQVYARLTDDTAIAGGTPPGGDAGMAAATMRLASAAGAGADVGMGGMRTHHAIMLSPRVIAILSSLDPIPGGFKATRPSDEKRNTLDAVA